MTPWRVARSLDTLLAEINTAAPNRSKISDGSIGDAAHQAGWESSDHNPWVAYQGTGIVRARDFTHDPQGGLDCNVLAVTLADLLRTGAHPACRSGAYVIWNRRILSADRRSEGWRAYTGSNPHDHHLHLSVALAQPGYDSTAPWHVTATPQEDDTMQLTDRLSKDDDAPTVGQVLRRLDRFATNSAARERAILKALTSLPTEIASQVEADPPAGVDPAQLRRLVERAATNGVRDLLGSLDE